MIADFLTVAMTVQNNGTGNIENFTRAADLFGSWLQRRKFITTLFSSA